MMFQIKITEDKLKELSMLADWQLKENGFDPESVTAAKTKLDEMVARKAALKLQDDSVFLGKVKLNHVPICTSTSCSFRSECAQHASAGDFRTEDGLTPELYTCQGQVYCNKTVRNEDHGMGALKINNQFEFEYLE